MTDIASLMSPEADCKDLLKCAYSLTSAETELMGILLRDGESKVDDLASIVNKDKSTVYRSLQRLVSCRLVMKEKHLLKKGGYYYMYRPMQPDAIKKQLRECANQWHDRMLELTEFVDTLETVT